MPGPETVIPLPAKPDACDLSDWAESTMLIEKRKRLSRSDMRQRLQNILYGEDLDIQLEFLLAEVERRHRIAGNTYPFQKTIVGLEINVGSDRTLYEFLLWLSISPSYRQEKRFDEIDALFDRIVKQALINYLGTTARGVRFAHPSTDGRPTNFPEALAWLADLLNLTTGSLNARPHVKDGGTDVVAWKPFRDQRAGYAIVLCQCTAQLNWPPKAKDIIGTKWSGWIGFGVPPLTAIAIPFAVGTGFDRWEEVHYTVNVILDRVRLCELLDPSELEDHAFLRDWSQKERAMLTVPVEPTANEK